MHCHIHDPNRKRHGHTPKCGRCGSVAKVGEKYCWRHCDAEGEKLEKKKCEKNVYKKGNQEQHKEVPLHPADVEDDESSSDEPASR